MKAPSSVEGYLAALPASQRALFERLRRTIMAAAPGATETISYGMPALRAHGRLLVGYAAFKDHCSLFPMSLSVFDTFGDEVAPYRSGKGTIRFTGDRPLPAALVRKVVQARLAENAARARRA